MRLIALALGVAAGLGPPAIRVAAQDTTADGVWRALPETIAFRTSATPWIQPAQRRLFELDATALDPVLASAPREFSTAARATPRVLALPMPDGGFAWFYVEDSPVMHPDLAARFPDIRTYIGRGIDDPSASARIDWTPKGFHAQILSPSGAVYVDPFWDNDSNVYASYFKADYRNPAKTWQCLVEGSAPAASRAGTALGAAGVSSGDSLRTYRLAVAATGEYTQFQGGSVSNAMAAIVTSINRVTGIYELELAIRFELIADNDLIVYTNGATDPYTNDDGSAMQTENQNSLTAVIGLANFDVGHVFSTGGGGIATLGSVCIDIFKARGVTGNSFPVGDPFDIDFVAHEIGHQFGGEHTFNGDSSNCAGGNRNGATAYEPGSGSTIMAYAGICGNDNLQNNSDPYFHAASHDNIITFVTGGGVFACPVSTATGNSAPTVSAGPAYTIPRSTPFALTAAGGDVDGDPITYTWEEWDLGPQADVLAPDNGSSPLFRSWSPTSSPTRTFPRLGDLLSNTTVIGEHLPTTSRTMAFRVTARDNRAGGGGVSSDNTTVTVDASSGPFLVTYPNTAARLSGEQTVTWNVAGTVGAPVNAATVNILLSTDGGLTFPTLLASGVPNNGSATVVLPNLDTTSARIKVEGNGNIFFDVSNVDFSIEPAPGLSVLPLDPFASSGGEGGSFTPPCMTYTLTNGSPSAVTWSAIASDSWIAVSPTGGVLSGLATTSVDVCISTAAPALAVGSYTGSVSVTNLTDESGEARNVSLEVLPAGGFLQFTAAAAAVDEGQGVVTAVVERVGASTGPVSVSYATSNGTALAGADYTAAIGSVSWVDGDAAPKDIVVQILDDSDDETDESLTLNLLIASGGAQIGSPASMTLTISDNDSSDTCETAEEITGVPFLDTRDTGAATSAGDPAPSCIPTLGRGIWYTVTPPADGLLIMDTEGSGFDTGLSLYTGSCGSLVEIACDDDGGAGTSSALTVDVTQGVTYCILVGGFNGSSGSLAFYLDYQVCNTSPVADGGFDGGSPWADWTIQTSTQFGSPICSILACGTGFGVGPESGANWVWFGGAGNDVELATVGQVVTIPGDSATLRFDLWIGNVTFLSTDELRIKVDGDLLDTIPEPLTEESWYATREVNVNAYADGGSHTILFEYEDTGFGQSDFNVDNVRLETCAFDSDLDGIVDSLDPDDDNDGIPDAWETQHGMNPLNPDDASLDIDLDGATGFEEYIADTIPTNTASVLKLRIALTPGTLDRELAYDSSSNRLYFIDVLTNLVVGPWTTLATNVPGSGGTNSVTVTNASGVAHFRLGAELP